jgi:hypothetical protein
MRRARVELANSKSARSKGNATVKRSNAARWSSRKLGAFLIPSSLFMLPLSPSWHCCSDSGANSADGATLLLLLLLLYEFVWIAVAAQAAVFHASTAPSKAARFFESRNHVDTESLLLLPSPTSPLLSLLLLLASADVSW